MAVNYTNASFIKFLHLDHRYPPAGRFTQCSSPGYARNYNIAASVRNEISFGITLNQM